MLALLKSKWEDEVKELSPDFGISHAYQAVERSDQEEEHDRYLDMFEEIAVIDTLEEDRNDLIKTLINGLLHSQAWLYKIKASGVVLPAFGWGMVEIEATLLAASKAGYPTEAAHVEPSKDESHIVRGTN